MYRVDGTRRLSEHELSHLPGYDGAQPVRVGNAASSQRQIDVFGEILDAFGLARRAGIAPSSMQYLIERALVEHIAKIWQEPDQGMWESRGEPRHYTYSKVMCWVGVDRFLRHNGSTLDKASRGSYENLRRAIHEEVCREGYDFGTGSFVHYLGGHSVDASLLLLPLVGFLPIDDERIAGTIARVENELMQDGLVLRHPKDENPHQGAFITCGFWLVDCWRMQGRNREARALFARLAALANDLGLLSEEYSVSGRRLAGNFPQALSHLSLINAVLGFAGTVLQRAGG
jgi:GH15 family glucan-1,4-alpha-glucosidase